MSYTTPSAPNPPSSPILTLPSELLLQILSHLDIPDLLALSRTSKQLRQLCLDPLLHTHRLHRASLTLAQSIPLRPSLAELMALRIYVTRTTLAARRLGRSLVAIKLNRKLAPGRRPSVEELVGWGVLPEECFGGRGVVLAPGLVETKRRVERERVKDVLRGWVEEWRKRGCEKGEEGEERLDVRRLARRFGREERDGDGNGNGYGRQRWGKRVVVKEAPTRAKVLGLRRFWEKVGRDGVAG